MNIAMHPAQPPPASIRPEPPVVSVPGQACCCPARAVVRVLIPPSPGRQHSTDLLLCGHHYRVSVAALAAAGAYVSRIPGPADSPQAALLPDFPLPRTPVS